jgi:hypothetical protein
MLLRQGRAQHAERLAQPLLAPGEVAAGETPVTVFMLHADHAGEALLAQQSEPASPVDTSMPRQAIRPPVAAEVSHLLQPLGEDLRILCVGDSDTPGYSTEGTLVVNALPDQVGGVDVQT